jgi:folylpolyglutamate synthase/dihydropteroate synthase
MKDKAIKEMLMLLRNSFDEILITDIDYERACKIPELEKFANEINLNVSSVTNPGEYVASFKEEDSSKCLVVLGSMYLLGVIKTDLERIKIS